jgi:hypothetical protein
VYDVCMYVRVYVCGYVCKNGTFCNPVYDVCMCVSMYVYIYVRMELFATKCTLGSKVHLIHTYIHT